MREQGVLFVAFSQVYILLPVIGGCQRIENPAASDDDTADPGTRRLYPRDCV